jgi:hypothetical protein
MQKNHEGESVQTRIDSSVETSHCAYCGPDLKGVRIVGSGSFSEGLSCSLDCDANLHGTKRTASRGDGRLQNKS